LSSGDDLSALDRKMSPRRCSYDLKDQILRLLERVAILQKKKEQKEKYKKVI
jgi:hypothetical protein